MEQYTETLSRLLVDKGNIESKDFYRIYFALEVVFSNVISFLVVVILGILFNAVIELIGFIIVFIGFRLMNDRYHAKTFWRCLWMTTATFLGPVSLSRILPMAYVVHFVSLALLFNGWRLIKFKYLVSEQFLFIMGGLNICIMGLAVFYPHPLETYFITLTIVIVGASTMSKS